MRLGDAEREILFEQLGWHASAGRIDMRELERRLDAIAAATTREQAAAVMAGLPPLEPASGGRARRRFRARHGHGEAATPAPDWQPTAERFRDPGTNQVMRVWVDSGGGRHYVPEVTSS